MSDITIQILLPIIILASAFILSGFNKNGWNKENAMLGLVVGICILTYTTILPQWCYFFAILIIVILYYMERV